MIAVPPFAARRPREEETDCVNRVTQIWSTHKGLPETITKRLRLPLIAARIHSAAELIEQTWLEYQDARARTARMLG